MGWKVHEIERGRWVADAGSALLHWKRDGEMDAICGYAILMPTFGITPARPRCALCDSALIQEGEFHEYGGFASSAWPVIGAWAWALLRLKDRR